MISGNLNKYTLDFDSRIYLSPQEDVFIPLNFLMHYILKNHSKNEHQIRQDLVLIRLDIPSGNSAENNAFCNGAAAQTAGSMNATHEFPGCIQPINYIAIKIQNLRSFVN